jgi:hypothetical protein
MSFSSAQTLVRDHGLPQRKAAVVRRNLGVQEHVKAATPQLYHRSTQKVQVLEAAAAQANPVHPVAWPMRLHTSPMAALKVL